MFFPMIIAEEVFSRRPASAPAAPCEAAGGTVAVLEWKAWDGFLLRRVLGEAALRIEIDPFRAFPPALFERVCQSVPIVCFQINLSLRRRLPLRIRDLTRCFAERGVYVVNGLVQDIRKSTLHAHLKAIGLPSPKADPSGPPDELLFVKTDLNYGGELERWLPPDLIASAGFAHLISPDFGAYRYQVVERGNLSETVWRDPALVVEKYINNPEHSFYRVYFSGKQVIIVKAFSGGLVKKLSNDPRDTNFVSELDVLKDESDRLPLSARLKRDVAAFVENTPVEFGCLDVMHDGRDNHFIVDLNLTPYGGTRVPDSNLSNFLRRGITHPHQRKPAHVFNSPLA